MISVVELLQANLVIGHGDIDQKNVIWKDDQTPVIIDWESVSMTNPDLEIVDAALNWAGLLSGTIQIDSMKAVMNGYKSVGLKLSLTSRDILNACILKWMSWLDANLRKEDDAAFLQVTSTVKNISLIVEKFDVFESVLESYR
jgi:thiamine kinase-like enzyme